MKKIVTISGVALFFLIILGAILLKLFLPSHTEAPKTLITPNPFADISPQVQVIYNDSPYCTALTCYEWYVHVYGNEANANLVANRPEAAQCYTPTFISSWPSLIDSTGSDPIVLSQDSGPTWSSIAVSAVGQSVNTADEKVIIGTGTDQKTVIAHLEREQDSTWRIEYVTDGSTTDGTP